VNWVIEVVEVGELEKEKTDTVAMGEEEAGKVEGEVDREPPLSTAPKLLAVTEGEMEIVANLGLLVAVNVVVEEVDDVRELVGCGLRVGLED